MRGINLEPIGLAVVATEAAVLSVLGRIVVDDVFLMKRRAILTVTHAVLVRSSGLRVKSAGGHPFGHVLARVRFESVDWSRNREARPLLSKHASAVGQLGCCHRGWGETTSAQTPIAAAVEACYRVPKGHDFT